MKLTEKEVKEIYAEVGNIRVESKEKFSHLPSGHFVSHSWAGNSGDRVDFRPVLFSKNQVLVGNLHPNYTKELSNNGQYGGEDDYSTTLQTLCEKYGGDSVLLGLVLVEERYVYNTANREDRWLVLFKEVSTLTELLKAKKNTDYSAFAESVLAVYA